jgi:hypothetical protein
MQHIYDDMEFRSPFFLTYLTNSLLMIYLPLWQVWLLAGAIEGKRSVNSDRCNDTDMDSSRSSIASSNDLQEKLHANHILDDQYSPLPLSPNTEDGVQSPTTNNQTLQPGVSYTHMDVVRVALVIAPLYVLSNGLYNYSLFMTSVSSSTIIRYPPCRKC